MYSNITSDFLTINMICTNIQTYIHISIHPSKTEKQDVFIIG